MTGIVFIAISVVCLYLSRKRKIDRTNSSGVAQFPCYFGKLKARLDDGVLLWASVFLSILCVMILPAEHQEGWGGWVLPVVYGWLLIGYVPGQRNRKL